MASRFYAVQSCSPVGGWVDVGVYSKKEFACIDHASVIAEKTSKVTRVIRKPHSFEPNPSDIVL